MLENGITTQHGLLGPAFIDHGLNLVDDAPNTQLWGCIHPWGLDGWGLPGTFFGDSVLGD